MKPIKLTKNLEFDVKYEDGSRKEVKEGVLFEFQGNRIKTHLGTDRKECIFSIAEALTEVINGLGLGREFLNYMEIKEDLE